jgi:fumarate reductase flavoprotein subunit
MSRDYDVVIVGGGGAGMSAALTATAKGARPIILEAGTKLGGATWWSTGVFYAAGTSVQRARGIVDSADDMFNYLMTLAQWAVRPDLIRILSDRSAEAVEWLIKLGVDFPAEWLVSSGVDLVPRGHPARGAGAMIADALANEVGAKGIETAFGTRVDGLIVEDGAVVGIRTGDTELRAPAVVITTGGFGNNFAMIERLFPSAARHGDRLWAVHHRTPFIEGDGITLGESIGARITGFDQGLLLPTSGFGKFEEAFLPPWVMLVNKDGRRFMAEYCAYTVSGYLISDQPESRAFAIFDEPTLAEAGADVRFADPYSSGTPTPTWDEAMIRSQVATGKVKVSDTIEGLAAAFGIDPLTLGNTAAEYNRNCRNGEDPVYFKESVKYFPVEKPPFYGIEIRPSIIGFTATGLDIDRTGRVHDIHDRIIPGLYAAGEVLGCVQGPRYGGGGMSIANAIILGRLAGETAAEAALAAAD